MVSWRLSPDASHLYHVQIVPYSFLVRVLAVRLPARSAQEISIILGHSAAGWITVMKNRNRDHPACSAVPQSTSQPCAPNDRKIHIFLAFIRFSLGLCNSRVLIIFRIISD